MKRAFAILSAVLLVGAMSLPAWAQGPNVNSHPVQLAQAEGDTHAAEPMAEEHAAPEQGEAATEEKAEPSEEQAQPSGESSSSEESGSGQEE